MGTRQTTRSEFVTLTEFILTSLVFTVVLSSIQATVLAQNNLPQATVQQPTFGVSVDAQGVLATTELQARELDGFDAGRQKPVLKDRGIDQASPNRKVSLRRLLAKIVDRKNEQPVEEELLALAGLTRIEYVFFEPETSDVVIAGPAGAWDSDQTGRRFNLESGEPVVQLEDLAVALAATTGAANEWFGCSIDPNPASLKKLEDCLLYTSPSPRDQRGSRMPSSA